MGKKYISYLRVSTDKQGRSGLGLEAQRTMISIYAAQHGSIVAEYVEVDSGGDAARPQLALARKHAKKTKAVILTAKVDRLSRSVSFIANLIDTGVAFETCETGPNADIVMIHMRAMMAEWERKMISARTKAALAAKKARGERLGRADFEKVRHLGPQKWSALRAEANIGRARLAAELRERGLTFDQIAREFEERGMLTPRGGDTWAATQVRRLVEA